MVEVGRSNRIGGSNEGATSRNGRISSIAKTTTTTSQAVAPTTQSHPDHQDPHRQQYQQNSRSANSGGTMIMLTSPQSSSTAAATGITTGIHGYNPQHQTHQQQKMLPPRPESRSRQTPPLMPTTNTTSVAAGYRRSTTASAGAISTGTGTSRNSLYMPPVRAVSVSVPSSSRRAYGPTSASASVIMSSASSIALSRDMSDISGLSGNTFSYSRGVNVPYQGGGVGTVPGQIFDPKSFQGPWKQAYVLSVVPPEQKSAIGRGNNNASIRRILNGGHRVLGRNNNKDDSFPTAADYTSGPSIWVARNDVVEIFDNLQSTVGLDLNQHMTGHNRIPVLILLMNPSKHTYELLQMWVDRANDSVRDIVHVLQHKIPTTSSSITTHRHHNHQHSSEASTAASVTMSAMPSTNPSNNMSMNGYGQGCIDDESPTSHLYNNGCGWKQNYDGLVQVRGTHFTQLINIIRVGKYDIQPHEILIAKPWGMTAKMTIGYATSAIRHLTKIGAINPNEDVLQHGSRVFRPKSEDSPLLLSKAAQDRCYFPEGILNHHHAIQYLTFSPPFESNTPEPNHQLEIRGSNYQKQYSQQRRTTVSIHDDDCTHASSLGSDGASEYGFGQRLNTLGSLSSGNAQIITSPTSPKSVTNPPKYASNRGAVPLKGFEVEDDPAVSSSRRQSLHLHQQRGITKEGSFLENDGITSTRTRGVLSRLNCCRYVEGREHGMKDDLNDNLNDTAIISLSEEEEQAWFAYGVHPIEEEQSVTGVRSVVSSSAPLLNQSNQSTTPARRTAQNTRESHQPSHPQQQRLNGGTGPGYGYMPNNAYEI